MTLYIKTILWYDYINVQNYLNLLPPCFKVNHKLSLWYWCFTRYMIFSIPMYATILKNPFYRLEVSWELSFLYYSPSKFSKSVFEHTYTQLITVGPQKGNFRYLNLIKGDKCKSNKRGLHFYFIALFQKIVQINFTWTQVLQNKQIHFVSIITGIITNLVNLYFICVWRKFYDTVFL